MNLRQKLVAISKNIGFLEFDGNNPLYNKGNRKGPNYTTAAGVIRRLNTELSKHHILLRVCSEDVIFYPESDLATVSCCICFSDCESEETVLSWGSGSGKDKGDKAVMKASTAAYKYAIAQALCLGWGAEDPEDPKHDASAKPGKTKRTANKATEAGRILENIPKATERDHFTRLKLAIQKLDPTSEEFRTCSRAFDKRHKTVFPEGS